MELIKKQCHRFATWFTSLSGGGKFLFIIILISLVTGGWLLSFILSLIWWIVSLNAQEKRKKVEQKLAEAQSYLTPIIQAKMLPTLTVDVNLQKDEKCCYMESNVPLAEERSVRVTVGGGTSFRVMKGVYAHSYSSTSVPRQTITRIDTGTLFLTNKRLIFLGRMRSKNIKLDNILATHQYSDAICISISSGTNGKNEYFLVKNPLLVRGMLTLAPYGDDLKKVKNINIQYQIT